RRAARIELGGIEQVKEQIRDSRSGAWFDSLLRDVRYVFRVLRKNPGFTAVVVLTLALGIGATTLIFSVFYGVFFKPVSYRDPDRLVQVHIHDLSSSAVDSHLFSVPEFLEYRHQNHVFADLAGVGGGLLRYQTAEGTELFQGGFVSANTFDVLGVHPLLG